MIEKCEKCGANLALVGRVHNCRGQKITEKKSEDNDLKPVAARGSLSAIPASNQDQGSPGLRSEKSFDRNAYQKEYMRRWRAKQKESKL